MCSTAEVSTMSELNPNSILAYAEPRTLEPLPPVRKSVRFWAVIGCWIVPLVIGLTIVEMARLNRPYEVVYKFDADSGEAPPPNAADLRRGKLEVAGVCDILGGTVASLIGIGCVIAFVAERKRPAPNRITGLVIPLLMMLFLLASNFIVAVICLNAVG